MLLITCFKHHAQVARVHIRTFAITFVVNRNNISTKATYYLAKSQERTRTICHFHQHFCSTSPLHQTAVNHTAQYGHINVTATHNAAHIFAFNIHLVEHGSRHTHSTCTFCNKFMLFNKRKNCCTNFILRHTHNVVNILLHQFKGMNTRFFYCNTIGNGQHIRKCFYLVMVYTVKHTGSTFCLYPHYTYRGFKHLHGISHPTC